MEGMDELLKLLAVPTHTGHTEAMYEFLRVIGTQRGWKLYYDEKWNLYAVKGEGDVATYPCVVAHMDTVHHIEKEGSIMPLVIDGNIIGFNPAKMQLTGIGGDDKCGIWAAIYCMDRLPACKAVFFVDEERGCQGSGNCTMGFFADCRYILQADRRGNADFVTDIWGKLSSKEFLDAVDPVLVKWGYKHSDGAMTDVRELRDKGVGISVANMSAGYYRPHSDGEFINIKDLEECCGMMLEIFEKVTDVYRFVYQKWSPPAPAATKSSGKGHSVQSSFPDYEPEGGGGGFGGLVRCDYCATLTLVRELIEGSDGVAPFVCLDCALHKEEHGTYPKLGLRDFWSRLSGGKTNGMSRKEKRRAKKRFYSIRRNGKGKEEVVVTHGGPPGSPAAVVAKDDKDDEVPF